MIALVLLVIIVYVLNQRHNERMDRIKELEQRLNDYYNEREKRLNASENLDKNNSAKNKDSINNK